MHTNQSAGAGWEARQVRKSLRLAAWSIASGATWVFAVLGSQYLWHGNRTVSAVVIAVNVVVGFGLLRAQRDYLRCLDEMQQRIYLESMGLALAVGLEAGLVYWALAITKVINTGADVGMAVMIVLMLLTHVGGIVYGNFWRFR